MAKNSIIIRYEKIREHDKFLIFLLCSPMFWRNRRQWKMCVKINCNFCKNMMSRIRHFLRIKTLKNYYRFSYFAHDPSNVTPDPVYGYITVM
jgi:hypothetical protein